VLRIASFRPEVFLSWIVEWVLERSQNRLTGVKVTSTAVISLIGCTHHVSHQDSHFFIPKGLEEKRLGKVIHPRTVSCSKPGLSTISLAILSPFKSMEEDDFLSFSIAALQLSSRCYEICKKTFKPWAAASAPAFQSLLKIQILSTSTLPRHHFSISALQHFSTSALLSKPAEKFSHSKLNL